MGSQPKFEVVEWALDHASGEAWITVRATYERFTFEFDVAVAKDDLGKFIASGDALKSAAGNYMSYMANIHPRQWAAEEDDHHGHAGAAQK